MGTLFILLLTSACFTDFQRVNDKNGLVKDDLQYGGTNDSRIIGSTILEIILNQTIFIVHTLKVCEACGCQQQDKKRPH